MSARTWACFVAGERAGGRAPFEVRYPYTSDVTGRVAAAGEVEREEAVRAAIEDPVQLTRFERSALLERARAALAARAEEFADLIRSESGLCLADTRHEVARSQDVLRLAAAEVLRDDGEAYACDVSPHGAARRIFTIREPLALAVAITPFNHPLNQVVHKLAPAIAAGTPVILKPSEKTPLTALAFAELLYEAGLPGPWLSVLVGPHASIAAPLFSDPRVELASFTGSVAVGKALAGTVGYKRLCLELGGNSPLIVARDADLSLATDLAAEGSFRNSGQRCTAVKRILVAEEVAGELVERLAAATGAWVAGDPADPETRVGTVIDEAAAERLEGLVRDAVVAGARVVAGGGRRGAQLEPTVLADVPRSARLVTEEAFGPLAPIVVVRDLDDAIGVANSTPYGLAAGVVTRDLETALAVVRRVRTGTVNVNAVPGFRSESAPFGGVKDSGLGIKEGVVESIKQMTNVKTFSLPW